MTEEELIELIADQGTHVEFFSAEHGPWRSTDQKKDVYTVSLFGWYMDDFDTQEDAEKSRQIVKNYVKKDIKRILFNKQLSNKLHEIHENDEITIAVKRQKELMKK